MKKTPLILSLIASSWLSAACEPSRVFEASQTSSQHQDEAAPPSQDQSFLTLPELQSTQFKVTGVRVGLISFLFEDTPQILFTKPGQADYIEVLRCPHDLVFRDAFGQDIWSDEAQSRQDLWKSAAGDCRYIAENYTKSLSVLDASLPSGSFRYLLRACVDQSRLIEPDRATGQTCSDQVSQSPLLLDYTNKRQEAEREALGRARRLESKVDAIGRDIYFNSVELKSALDSCEEMEKDRSRYSDRVAFLSKTLGFGVGLGNQILLSDATQSYVERAKEIWGQKEKIKSNQATLAGVLQELFTTSKLFPRSCSLANRLTAEGERLVKELEIKTKEHAVEMDLAKSLAEAR